MPLQLPCSTFLRVNVTFRNASTRTFEKFTDDGPLVPAEEYLLRRTEYLLVGELPGLLVFPGFLVHDFVVRELLLRG